MAFLKRDELLNADILTFLSSGGKTLKETEDGVLVKTADNIYVIDALSKGSYRELSKYIPKGKGIDICAHQSRFAPLLLDGKGENTKLLPCWEYVYRKKELFEENDIKGFEFKPLSEKELDFVDENYGEPREYILRCLNSMIGAFKDGKCVGFAGLHPNGEVGLLKVIPEYRGKGIGRELEKRIANRRIKSGYTPYNFVVVGNDVSVNLQEELGFERAERMTTWVIEK